LSWTVAATWGGLVAAADFAAAFGEMDRAQRYQQAASEIKAGAEDDLWQPQLNCFARMITQDDSGAWQDDKTIDASLVGLWKFGMYAPDDPKIIATMQVIRDRLWVKTPVGGLARYENDRYHQVSADTANVPGNPWFICTLWLAEWYAATAETQEDLQLSLDLLRWVANHALPSGVLAEQLHPYTGEPLSVSPLTWSHAEFVTSVNAFLQAWRRLT